MWVCPTLVALQSSSEVLRERESWSALGKSMVTEWTTEVEEMKPFDAVAETIEKEASIVFREMGREHVHMLAGTDIGNPGLVPGASLHSELKLMVRAGMSPKDALFAATIAPLQFLGIEGGIEDNRPADLVLLAGNPLEDIANVDRIVAVWLNGKYFDRAALDGMLKPKP
jgi:imidazolonepropionase-like amidohydrolase